MFSVDGGAEGGPAVGDLVRGGEARRNVRGAGGAEMIDKVGWREVEIERDGSA